MNRLYKTTPALYEIEDSWDGFEWLAPNDGDRNFLAYQRKDRNENVIVVLINFSGEDYTDYHLGIPEGKYRVIFNSDSSKYGGSGISKKLVYTTKKTCSHGKEHSIVFNLPKLSCMYLEKINKI